MVLLPCSVCQCAPQTYISHLSRRPAPLWQVDQSCLLLIPYVFAHHDAMLDVTTNQELQTAIGAVAPENMACVHTYSLIAHTDTNGAEFAAVCGKVPSVAFFFFLSIVSDVFLVTVTGPALVTGSGYRLWLL